MAHCDDLFSCTTFTCVLFAPTPHHDLIINIPILYEQLKVLKKNFGISIHNIRIWLLPVKLIPLPLTLTKSLRIVKALVTRATTTTATTATTTTTVNHLISSQNSVISRKKQVTSSKKRCRLPLRQDAAPLRLMAQNVALRMSLPGPLVAQNSLSRPILARLDTCRSFH